MLLQQSYNTFSINSIRQFYPNEIPTLYRRKNSEELSYLRGEKTITFSPWVVRMMLMVTLSSERCRWLQTSPVKQVVRLLYIAHLFDELHCVIHTTYSAMHNP